MRLAIVALGLAAIVAIVLWPSVPNGDNHEVQLLVNDPDGGIIFVGTSSGATVYEALRFAAKEHGFSVGASGADCSLYVHTIDGHSASGRSGWVYETDGVHATVSAGCMATEPGMEIWWHWETV